MSEAGVFECVLPLSPQSRDGDSAVPEKAARAGGAGGCAEARIRSTGLAFTGQPRSAEEVVAILWTEVPQPKR